MKASNDISTTPVFQNVPPTNEVAYISRYVVVIGNEYVNTSLLSNHIFFGKSLST